MRVHVLSALCAAALMTALPAYAQTAAPAAPADGDTATAAGKIVLLFDSGSDALTADSEATLDKVARLYRDGNPVLMIVSGATDSTGNPASNLLLSQRRANTVQRGMLARGIPAERTQILAKGETVPAVSAPKGTAEPQNRRVEISWR